MEDILRARIFNEVRISFEFFARQYGGEDVNKVLVLSSGLKQGRAYGTVSCTGLDFTLLRPSSKIFSERKPPVSSS